MAPKYVYRKRTNKLSVLVARRVRGLRRAHGLTQRDLGEICGVSQGMVNKWEQRLVPIDLEDLEKLAGALGVEPYQLLNPALKFSVGRPGAAPVVIR